MLHGEQYPFIRVQQRPCPKGAVNFSLCFLLLWLFLFLLPRLSRLSVFFFFSMLFSPLLSQGLAEIGRCFNESYSLSLSPPLYAAPWALVIRHRSFHELLLSAFWNNRKKNKAPLQLAQVIIGCYYSVGTGLGGAWCMSSSPLPSRQSPPDPPPSREVGCDTLPFLPTHIHKQKALAATVPDAEPSKHSIWMCL